MLNPIRFPRPTLPAALLAASSLIVSPLYHVQAQGTTIQTPYAIRLDHASVVPYNFTGRIYDVENGDVGSGTLIRRHTILTAAHVVSNPTTGFTTGIIFQRALYENFSLSQNQEAAVSALSGYQAVATTDGTETIASGARDLGYVVTVDAPVDGNWGTYYPNPNALTDNSGRFILGYPAVTFDGRTMTYLVPTTPFVGLGAVGSGLFSDTDFSSEGGNSGGPVYSVQNGNQVIVGEFIAGTQGASTAGNLSLVRAIDTEADQFLTQAEYTQGLIASIHIKGPTSVNRGSTAVIKLRPLFLTPSTNGDASTTTRYKELTLTSDTAGTPSQPALTITKVNNKKFTVNFSTSLRSLTTVNFTAAYSVTSVPGPIDPITGSPLITTTTTTVNPTTGKPVTTTTSGVSPTAITPIPITNSTLAVKIN